MNRLKELRGNKSQSKIASIIGTSQVTYSRYEKEETQMDYDTLRKLADYYHVTIDYLLCHDIDAQNVAIGQNCNVVAAGDHNNFSPNNLGEIESEIIKELEGMTSKDKIKIYNYILQLKGE